ILLTRISVRLRALRVEAGVVAEVTFDGEQVLRVRYFGRRFGRGEAEPLAHAPLPGDGRRRDRLARNHRDRVVGTLRGAVAAADTGLRGKMNLPDADTT